MYSMQIHFLITPQNKHYMKQMLLSLLHFKHFLFLTSSGNIFTLGDNEYGKCGVKQIAIDDDNKDNTYTKKITEPYHLKYLSKRVITNIYVGGQFSLCLDKNKNLYCWGKNKNNVMALDTTKYEQDDDDRDSIIWEPVLHDIFNNGDNGKIIRDIRCGDTFICFIDVGYQCYWSPPIYQEIENGEETNIVHFQSLCNEKYKDLKIILPIFKKDIDVDYILIVLIDIEQRLYCYRGDAEDVEQRLFDWDIPVIDPGDGIVNGFIKDCITIFVKKRLRM